MSTILQYKPNPLSKLRRAGGSGEFYSKLWDSRALGSLRNTAMNRIYDVWAKFPDLEDTQLHEFINRLAANAHIKTSESEYGLRIRTAMEQLVLSDQPEKSVLSASEFKDLEATVKRVAALDLASKILTRLANAETIDYENERIRPPPTTARALGFRVNQYCKGKIGFIEEQVSKGRGRRP